MEVIEDYAGQYHFGGQLMAVMETYKKNKTGIEPRNWRWWCYAEVQSKKAAKYKILFLHGKGIDQVIDNLGTRLQL